MKKPKTKNLGRIAIESDGKEYYVALPTGLVKIFPNLFMAETYAMEFIHSKLNSNGLISIEWRNV